MQHRVKWEVNKIAGVQHPWFRANIDRKIDLHRRKRAVLEDLFKTLLHKLMTGEIQVGNLAMTAGMP